MSITLPVFPGDPRKNDALFLYGITQQQPFVHVYEQDSIEVVHGPSCIVKNEVCVDMCDADNVPIVPRRTGGGTVVLCPGTLVIIVSGERTGSHMATWYFDKIHDAMIAVFAVAGINGIKKAGISDLAIGGKKILGSSLYLGSNPRRYYYQSSLLVAADVALFSQYLRHPPREPDYRASRSHKEFCTTLRAEGFATSAGDVVSLLMQWLPVRLRQNEG